MVAMTNTHIMNTVHLQDFQAEITLPSSQRLIKERMNVKRLT